MRAKEPDPRRDLRILYGTALLRAIATGMVGVLLGFFLARLRFDSARIGLIVGTGLGGAALAALLVTLTADRWGRKRVLVALAVLSAVGAAVFAAASNVSLLLVAAFLGMINGAGRDRGAALILDQAILPGTTSDQDRTRAFAWYNVLQDVGHAAGALLGGLPVLLRGALPLDETGSLRAALGVVAVLLAATAWLYAGLSPSAAPSSARRVPLTPGSRRTLWKISSLFAVDSVAGGFLTASLLAYFFFERFGASEATVAALFFGARLANAGSHLGAAWLARRIGLVNTMVFTHMPSSLLLATVAFAPNFPVAALLFLLREGLVEMDVPTRQSYVLGVVRPEERTVASGVTHLVRLGGWAVAPAFAGLLMRDASLATPLFIGSAMKIAYDVLLYLSFRRLKPTEEGD